MKTSYALEKLKSYARIKREILADTSWGRDIDRSLKLSELESLEEAIRLIDGSTTPQSEVMTLEDGKLFDLANTAYCKESESSGFLFNTSNGCSLDKSNGYGIGFINGFKKGYMLAQAKSDQLQSELEQVKGDFEECQKHLAWLVDLKYIKDTQGKTEFYLKEQPKVWEAVNLYVKALQQTKQ